MILQFKQQQPLLLLVVVVWRSEW